MNAVIKTGGKQYTIKKGDVINIEKIPGNPGDEVDFGEVLMVSDDNGNTTVGTPYIDSATVKGKILGEEKSRKITVFKFKRRKGYRRKNGHRQKHTTVEITDIK